MRTPLPFVAIFAVYLLTVVKILPAHMKNRKAYDISGIIRFYNVFQVLACTFLVVRFHNLGFSFRNTWKCGNKLEAGREDESFDVLWWFLALRTLELLETVFFILRKKQNQVSSLHVYHHISTIILTWLHLKYLSGNKNFFNRGNCPLILFLKE